MKPFDLDKAKAGEPVVTRDGRAVRILCFDRKSVDGSTILGLVEEGAAHEAILTWFKNGRAGRMNETPFDLFMLTKTVTRYVNLWVSGGVVCVSKPAYKTKAEAEEQARNNSFSEHMHYIEIGKEVSWEEYADEAV